ncbi:MAG: FAD/NAD(P)-binding protein [Verrucomicrobia bacterium]|nr:FAD/NAD(P)-binding protein [Verrucomicrobiota bacterium]MBV8376900.1 FAD/NAD(P)-binding protein [Verrucomicrobiota bacterium]
MSHLLNVPAGKMGAYAQDPEHFLRWCHEHSDSCRAAGVQKGCVFTSATFYTR